MRREGEVRRTEERRDVSEISDRFECSVTIQQEVCLAERVFTYSCVEFQYTDRCGSESAKKGFDRRKVRGLNCI